MGTMKFDNSENIQGKNNTYAQPLLSAEEILHLPANELLSRLDASTTGLSSQEAEKRLARFP
jgi:hypothetical protein